MNVKFEIAMLFPSAQLWLVADVTARVKINTNNNIIVEVLEVFIDLTKQDLRYFFSVGDDIILDIESVPVEEKKYINNTALELCANN